MNTQPELSQPKLSDFYNGKNYAGLVDLIKFLLMPFVFFALLGFPLPDALGNTASVINNYIRAISNFSGLAFFIFCGFFTLVPDKEWRMRKLVRAVKRSWLFFLILFLSYLALNVAYLAYIGQLRDLISPEFLRKRTFFDFLLLNVWPLPMGSGIWFIQSLAYSYLFFWLVEKLKLSKIYVPVLVILLIFMLCGGEFASFVGFPYLGYSSIPGGFLTKAIPFMLIGMLLRKFIDQLARIPRFVYIITFFAGILLSVGELFLLAKTGRLVYTGNMIGYAIMALSVCCFAVTKPDIGDTFLGSHGASYTRRMYALCQPVSLLIWFIFRLADPEILPTVTQFSSVICFVLCFGLAFLIGLIKFQNAIRKDYIKGENNF